MPRACRPSDGYTHHMQPWEFVGLIVGIVGIGVGIVAWLWPDPTNRRRKPVSRLEWLVISNQTLLHVPGGVSVKVSIDGRSVDQAYVTVLRVANTGTETFRSADWEAPMIVSLPGSSVISARQVAARPERFRVPSPTITGDRIEFAPFLINPGDLFDVQIVSEGPVPAPQLDVRIPGLLQARRLRRPVYPPGNGVDGALDGGNKVFYSLFGALFLALIAFMLFGPIQSASGVPLTFEGRLPQAGAIAGLFGAYVVFLRWATTRNRRWRPVERF